MLIAVSFSSHLALHSTFHSASCFHFRGFENLSLWDVAATSHFLGAFLQLCLARPGLHDLTHPQPRFFQLHPRPRDRTPRIARRLDINARATLRTRPQCHSAAAALGASAPTTISLRASVSAPITTPQVVSSNFSPCFYSGCLPRTHRQCAPMRLAPRASPGILSNSSFASGFGSNSGNAFGSNNNTTGGGMFGGNTTSTFGSGGTWLLCALWSRLRLALYIAASAIS